MLKRRTLLCLSAVALSQWACVSIDSRIAQERIDQDATRHLNGAFSNTATYASDAAGPFGPPALRSTLAELLGVRAADIDRVQLSFDPEVGLTIGCFAGDKEVGKGAFLLKDGLTVAPDGALELPKVRESLQFPNAAGRMTHSTRLFVNAGGDLVVVRGETEVDGGLMVIVPVVIVGHFKQLAVFRHVD